MLTHLHLRNFAIVDCLDLELGAGLTVLTGETGAGKSILIDALNLALGDRASQALLRPGTSRAEVGALFAPESGSPACAWLKENELDEATGECLLRRTIAQDGRSRAYINGRPVPVQMLRHLAERLVDIHGQHAHQSLLRRDAQREIVDARSGDAESVEWVEGSCRRYRSLIAELEGEARDEGDRKDRMEFLSWQIRELEAVNPSVEEFDELLAAHKVLGHGAELLEAGGRALDALDAEDAPSAIDLAASAVSEVSRMAPYLPETNEIRELVEGALIQLEEAGAALRRTRDRIDVDPDRLAQLDARLAELHASARRHRAEPRELADVLHRLRGERECLARSETRRAELGALIEAAAEDYRRAAKRVSEGRSAAALALGAEIQASLRQLGMQNARFRIDVVPEPEGPPAPHGNDRIDFLVSANPGQPLRSVSQVASGGELSRISLAVQASASHRAGVATLIFDEVDAGIGGRVAGIVGRRLRALSDARQVLCVTHLPQIASQAHHHISVEKRAAGNETTAITSPLSGESRVRELARMLAGAEPTSQSLAHAREMLERRRTSGPL